MARKRTRSAVHKDLRTPKYKLRVVPDKRKKAKEKLKEEEAKNEQPEV